MSKLGIAESGFSVLTGEREPAKGSLAERLRALPDVLVVLGGSPAP